MLNPLCYATVCVTLQWMPGCTICEDLLSQVMLSPAEYPEHICLYSLWLLPLSAIDEH